MRSQETIYLAIKGTIIRQSIKRLAVQPLSPTARGLHVDNGPSPLLLLKVSQGVP